MEGGNITSKLSQVENNELENINIFLDYFDKDIPAIRTSLDKLSENNLNTNEMISTIDHLTDLYNPISDKITTSYNEQREKKGINNDSAVYLSLLHELKNMIVTSPLLLELIKEDLVYSGELSQENQKSLNLIKDSVSNWESLSKNIRSLESSKLVIEKVNVTNIVNNSAKDFTGEFANKNINLSLNANENYSVMADPLQLKVIIDDVIKNAVKFTNKNGHIDISIAKVNGLAEIKIKDDGVGMSEDVRSRLLKESVNSSVGTGGERGTGTGLLIGSIIMNKMAGNIKIESEGEGKGTTVILTLPRGEE